MKKTLSFRTKECVNKICSFRFPLQEGGVVVNSCPKCGYPLKDVGGAYDRHTVQKDASPSDAPEIHVLLDNIRSIYNVGSIFRTAESVGIKELHLCGITATPDNPRLAKTAIGAESLIAWKYHNNALSAARMLQEQGFLLWSIEGGEKARPLFQAGVSPKNKKIALVIGNELAGIDPEIMQVSERVLYIPMQGQKESLNLTVAFGIAVYYLRYLKR